MPEPDRRLDRGRLMRVGDHLDARQPRREQAGRHPDGEQLPGAERPDLAAERDRGRDCMLPLVRCGQRKCSLAPPGRYSAAQCRIRRNQEQRRMDLSRLRGRRSDSGPVAGIRQDDQGSTGEQRMSCPGRY
jgi:hypothetical protein